MLAEADDAGGLVLEVAVVGAGVEDVLRPETFSVLPRVDPVSCERTACCSRIARSDVDGS